MTDLRALWDFDDPAGSEARFRDLAASSPAQAPLALTQVARALGLQERYAEGHAVLDSLDGDDPEVVVRRELERGRLHRSAGDPESSRPCFERAAAAAAAAGLEELNLDALHMLAIIAPPDQQVAAHETALAAARAATDPRARDWDASLLNNLGMTYADAGDFDAALASFEQALTARERIGDEGRMRVARWMVAWALRNLGRRDEALAMQRALKADYDAIGETDTYVDEEIALLTSDVTPGDS